MALCKTMGTDVGGWRLGNHDRSAQLAARRDCDAIGIPAAACISLNSLTGRSSSSPGPARVSEMENPAAPEEEGPRARRLAAT